MLRVAMNVSRALNYGPRVGKMGDTARNIIRILGVPACPRTPGSPRAGLKRKHVHFACQSDLEWILEIILWIKGTTSVLHEYCWPSQGLDQKLWVQRDPLSPSNWGFFLIQLESDARGLLPAYVAQEAIVVSRKEGQLLHQLLLSLGRDFTL